MVFLASVIGVEPMAFRLGGEPSILLRYTDKHSYLTLFAGVCPTILWSREKLNVFVCQRVCSAAPRKPNYAWYFVCGTYQFMKLVTRILPLWYFALLVPRHKLRHALRARFYIRFGICASASRTNIKNRVHTMYALSEVCGRSNGT